MVEQGLRPVLKRIAVWTAAVLLLIVAYFAGAPFVKIGVQRYAPILTPALPIIYAPSDYAQTRNGLPGRDEYASYNRWCLRLMGVMPPANNSD